MIVLITGTSQGIGKACAEYYLKHGHVVHGFDIKPSNIAHKSYIHHELDIVSSELPKIENINIIFHNAGVQEGKDVIGVNLKGTIRVNEQYAFAPSIKAVLFNASASARNGFEFPEYAASKAGVVGYMKNTAVRLAPLGAVANSISFGGVVTELNKPVMDDPECWKKIMDVTPLKKWVTKEEAAEWVYFLTVNNKSMSGQDILVDNGENDLNCTFVWPKKE